MFKLKSRLALRDLLIENSFLLREVDVDGDDDEDDDDNDGGDDKDHDEYGDVDSQNCSGMMLLMESLLHADTYADTLKCKNAGENQFGKIFRAF